MTANKQSKRMFGGNTANLNVFVFLNTGTNPDSRYPNHSTATERKGNHEPG